jgi:hypothetical protein
MSSTDPPAPDADNLANRSATLRAEIAEAARKSDEALQKAKQAGENLQKNSGEIDAANQPRPQ